MTKRQAQIAAKKRNQVDALRVWYPYDFSGFWYLDYYKREVINK